MRLLVFSINPRGKGEIIKVDEINRSSVNNKFKKKNCLKFFWKHIIYRLFDNTLVPTTNNGRKRILTRRLNISPK